jgi:exodeoxyribonuclease V alpha subunit
MNQDNNQEEIVRGVIDRITFHNQQNGYSVLQVTVKGKKQKITVVGNIINPRPGADIVARGSYIEHAKFGSQLQAISIIESVPTTTDGIQKYLSSGVIKGIGHKTAEKIVEAFGDGALEALHNDPENVAKITGVQLKKVMSLNEALAGQNDMGAIIQFLVEHDVSPNLASKIYEKYRNRSLEVLNEDPYVLARNLKGVGFRTADKIAKQLGLSSVAPVRLNAGILYSLDKASDDGHVFLSDYELSDQARKLLELPDDCSLEDSIRYLEKEKLIIRKNENVYLRQLYNAQSFVADFVFQRIQPRQAPLVPSENVINALSQASSDLGIEFSPEQKLCVELANSHQLLLITGGPGCGKTTVIKALTRFFQIASLSLVLAAPTGKASQRMSAVSEYPASTIHRLLKFDPSSGGFLHGIHDPLIADAIIIDEASMIDITLAKDLFSAIGPNTTLILVGDKDQLPSVGPGRVFGDILSLQDIKKVTLTRIFRRDNSSMINTFATQVNSGIVPEIPSPDGQTKTDCYFLNRPNADEASMTIVKLFSEQLPQKFGFEQNDITVLTPGNRGPLGVVELNRTLQEKLNPCELLERQLTFGELNFRVGDRVCQRVNNYNIDNYGVFNGDTGIVHDVEPRTRTMDVELWDGRLIKYEAKDISQLQLAYAITVHRSQGSEMPCVILALSETHFTLLERQLLYTAITRAKKLLVIVGSRQALSIATKRAQSLKRNSGLKLEIETMLG